MIVVFKERWQDIPVLTVVESAKKNEALPVLTYFHGYTSAKEHNLPIAYLLAEKGYRVVLPDSLHHGEREDGIPHAERELQFFHIVEQNLKDLSTIKRELDANHLIKEERFGVAGTSMGGITTAAALTQFPWIKVAAILMGSPKIAEYAQQIVNEVKKSMRNFPMSDEQVDEVLQSLQSIDLSKQMDKLMGRPLFFWHGDKDPVVPFDHSYSFYEEVTKQYKNPENIRFLREVGRGHKVSRFATLETVKWLEFQL
ncbi:prolyl oligopeptidase family serine peptidase [Radiobacillus kanasensis]|uniref:prolyl oligopeptidase family serine peptidase n=1 Tax=Radiobacillus kanasensis TaxID=2844358 RepID=UPI001E4E9E6D|nr:prolyl oligopeptidase family serine peptidase [Radiobacillus kanasensis]UFU00548.1 prolyl oligopeptidase family serine peptidase [Radiobacillus kanasensis]